MSKGRTNISKPIIFLDIDGVIIAPYKKGNTTHSFNPILVSRLKKIIDNTGAKIVISSSWKYNMDNLVDEWLLNDLEMFIDTTEHQYTEVKVQRQVELIKWIMHNKCTNYIVIDDCHRLSLPLFKGEGSLIKPDTKVGLTDEQVDKAIDLLNNKTF